MLTDDEKVAIGRKYVTANQRGDSETLIALHDENAVAWHNFDDQATPIEQASKALRWLTKHFPDVRFSEINVMPSSEGFILQWVIIGTSAAGEEFRIPSCVVATLSRSGQIVRSNEYVDSGQLAVLR